MLNETAYPSQVSVCDVVCVKIVKAFSYVYQLGRITLPVKCNCREGLTKLIRLASGFFSTNSIRLPFGIHSETTCKGSVVTPTKGTIFGCLSFFHIAASLKNDCETHKCS